MDECRFEIICEKKIINLQLRRYVSLSDYVILGLEITFCLFILYYIMEETLELRLGFHTTNKQANRAYDSFAGLPYLRHLQVHVYLFEFVFGDSGLIFFTS